MAATKTCRNCREEIHSKAKLCPHCRAKQGWTLGAKIGLACLLFFAALPAIVSTDGAPSHPTASSREQQKAPTPARGTEARVEYEVKKALGTSNRKVARVSKVQVADREVRVAFSVNDNLTENLVKISAQTDVDHILRAVQRSGYDYSKVTVVGTFSMRDKFGNTSEDNVLAATYQRGTVDRINWSGFVSDDTFAIADGVWLHPALR